MILNPTQETYDNLLMAFKLMNEQLFADKLPLCLITLQRKRGTMGYYSKNRFCRNSDRKTTSDEIALNPEYFSTDGQDERQVIQTLVHEMVHLWQHHFGEPGRRSYHNKNWSEKMMSVGLMPSSTGKEGGNVTGEHMSDYVIESAPFAKAYKNLIKSGFVLDWVESRPPQKRSLTELVGEGSLLDQAGNNEAGETPPNPADRSNRLKYSCPKCSLNAWAKPGANLVCGDCEEPLAYEFA
jgi:predicted SprT family Zn-dependent metalloprotease